MKHKIIFFLLLLNGSFFCFAAEGAKGASSQGANGESTPGAAAADTDEAYSKKLDADTSYAFGVLMGADLRQFSLEFDYDAFMNGFKQAMDNNSTISDEDALPLVQGAIEDAMKELAQVNLEKGERFLAENAKRAGVKTTESGLQYEVLKEGTGATPGADSVVRVNYQGSLIDGSVFDSSYKRGEPADFPLNRIIEGWTEGIQLMSVGAHYKLYIPSALAYGDRDVGDGIIPANSVLIFDVELLEIVE
jgi:FKBP-type peptidyl-prolyl cis-trans isomerase FkpA